MTKNDILTLSLALFLVLSLWGWRRSTLEARRLQENFRVVSSHNYLLRDSLTKSTLSVGRLRMTLGELEEFRAEDAERIRQMDIKLKRAQSLTKVESQVRVDTLILYADTPDTPSVEPLRPILTDSLYELRWSDAWVTLEVVSRPSESHLSLTSRDTLLQVVHRVPHKWWIFSWGTKAIRQEIRSSNPHTHLVYAEYLELE